MSTAAAAVAAAAADIAISADSVTASVIFF